MEKDYNAIQEPHSAPTRSAEELAQLVPTFLAKVREIVGDPEKWTQEAFARNRRGEKARVDEKACRFCLLVAIFLVQRELQLANSFSDSLIEKLAQVEETPVLYLTGINDGFSSHDAFLSWFDNRVEKITA